MQSGCPGKLQGMLQSEPQEGETVEFHISCLIVTTGLDYSGSCWYLPCNSPT